MDRYLPSARDTWAWRPAQARDVPDIVELVDTNYSGEIEDVIFTKNPTRLHYSLHKAILEMTYAPSQQLINVARDLNTDELVAWGWIERGKYTVYSDEEMGCAEFAHVDLSLPLRTKMTLVAQILMSWIMWCQINHIPVLTSSTMRRDQTGFMRLHDQFGFVRRGSVAYRRIV
jgi:hypothetical protein